MSAERVGGSRFDGEVDVAVRVSRVFAGITAEAIAQAGDGVTLPQLRVLVLASASGGLDMTSVAEALDVHISNASRLCERLVQAGLLLRRGSAADRRHVELTLTAAGAELVAAVTAHRRDVVTRALRVMSPQQRSSVAEAMAVFADVVDEQLERRHLATL